MIMQLLCAIIQKVESVPQIVSKLMESGLGDPTVINCEGAMHLLESSNIEPPPLFGVLRHLYSPTPHRAKLMMLVLPDEKIQQAEDLIDEELGGIESPNTGIFFALPISHVKGLAKN